MLRLLERWAVDGRFVLAVFLLTVFGIAMVYSAGAVNTPTPDVIDAWRRQLVWFALGQLPGASSGAAYGRVTVNVEPTPGSLSTEIVPPCATTIARAM